MTSTPFQIERKLAWTYLINLVFYLIPLFLSPYPLWKIALSLVVLIPFIASYFWAYKCNYHSAYKPILVMVLIGAAITPINPGSISLFTFAGFFIGFFYPLKSSIFFLLGLVGLLFGLNEVCLLYTSPSPRD